MLRAAFERFEPAAAGTSRRARAAFRAFLMREAWWLDDYALFRALHAENEGRYWREWEPGLRDRDPGALDAARARLAREILYYAWLQWIADEQWQRARRDAARVGIFGDFPFMVSRDSADVWARQHEFLVDASVGVPPDAFSATGQDWGLPGYRWDVMERGGYEWLRAARAPLRGAVRRIPRRSPRRLLPDLSAASADGTTRFAPPDEPSQLAQGERLLALFSESGAHIIAEDLGTVPDFVRESLARLGVPGLKVMRWEREWDTDGQPFREPSSYPEVSVATAGTHDTETLAEWWDCAPREERAAACELAALRGICSPDAPFSDRRPRRAPASASCDARSSLRARADPGHLRLEGPHQHASRRGRRELDVAAAVARRGPGPRAGSHRPCRVPASADSPGSRDARALVPSPIPANRPSESGARTALR